MALKNMIKVGDKVTFGRAGEKKVSGTVVKCNPKTAHVKTSKGTFSVTYGLIQKPGKKKPATKKKPITRAAVSKHNPANFTKKGERMYQHIKAGYRAAGKSEKDAKQIAASTVYMKARTIPGLVKKKSTTTTKKNPPKCSTTGRYAVIVRSGRKDHCTFATDNRAMANRAAKAMTAKGKNAFVWDKEKKPAKKNPPKVSRVVSMLANRVANDAERVLVEGNSSLQNKARLHKGLHKMKEYGLSNTDIAKLVGVPKLTSRKVATILDRRWLRSR